MSCKHGQLARQCNECALEQEVAELKAVAEELAEALRRIKPQSYVHPTDPRCGCSGCEVARALARWETLK